MPIIISTFGGEMPRVTPRLLEQSQAYTAINCQLQRGALEPLSGPGLERPLSSYAQTLFKHETDGWLTWPKVVNVVQSAVRDVRGGSDGNSGKALGHLMLTGDKEYPTQYLTGGDICRLGLPRPGTAPAVTLKAKAALADTTEVFGFGTTSVSNVPARYGAEGLPEIQAVGISVAPYADSALGMLEEGLENESSVGRSSSYCYTLVRSLADGVIQQESAPTPPSEVVDLDDGDGCMISGFEIPGAADMRVTHIRLYRTVSGLKSSEFRLLVELDAGTKEYMDTAHDKDVTGEVLSTSMWDAIPDGAQGLIKTDNGLYAAFIGNELLVSEPFIPYAFPAAYRLTVEDPIVALGHVDGTIIVLTRGRPYLAAGSAPESLQLIHLPIEQACVSARSVASLPGGVVYASPDGLMHFTANEQSLLTAGTFTREQWQAMQPETLIGTVHDGRYIGFFVGTGQGFVFSLGARDIVKVQLPTGWKVHGLYHHSGDDAVYLVVEITAENQSSYSVQHWEGGEDVLPYTWRSKPFFFSALTSISALRVEGEQSSRSPVEVRVFGPNWMRSRARLRLMDSRAKRLSSTRAEKLWSLELSGRAVVYEVRLGDSVEGVEHGQ